MKVISETKPINIKISNGTFVYELTYGSGTLIIWQYPVNLIKSNIFFLMNKDKNGIQGYIAVKIFKELGFALSIIYYITIRFNY